MNAKTTHLRGIIAIPSMRSTHNEQVVSICFNVSLPKPQNDA